LLQRGFRDRQFRAGIHGGADGGAGLRQLPGAGLETGGKRAEAQVERAVFDQGDPVQSCRIGRAPGHVADQRCVQREDATVARALHVWAQRVQSLVRGTGALLCPGPQQRLQDLGRALGWQAGELSLGRAPVAGLHVGIRQQQ
jgi:hypothetical protein